MTWTELIDSKWGDVVGIALIGFGVHFYKIGHTELGSLLIGSGLTALKLKTNKVGG